jgi:hypothetical protein
METSLRKVPALAGRNLRSFGLPALCSYPSPLRMTRSYVVRELAAGKGFLFANVGEVVPKGFDEAVRLYEVRWRE